MRLYTGIGDQGLTRLFGGATVEKDDVRVAAYGEVDELNCCIGLARNAVFPECASVLERIQSELFEIGAELASMGRNATIGDEHVSRMEGEIDGYQAAAPELRNFVLPAGRAGAAELHLARSVCRRAERAVVTLHRKEGVRAEVLRYLNRLSDLLFAMSRAVLARAGEKEIVWNPRAQEKAE